MLPGGKDHRIDSLPFRRMNGITIPARLKMPRKCACGRQMLSFSSIDGF